MFKNYILFFLYLLRWVLRSAARGSPSMMRRTCPVRRRSCPPGGLGGSVLEAPATWRPPATRRGRPSEQPMVSVMSYLPVLHFSSFLFSSKFLFLRSFSIFFLLCFDVLLATQANTRLRMVSGTKRSCKPKVKWLM